MGLRWRLILASLVFLVSLVYALPSVPVIGPALERVLPSSKINLGLDLKGGIHLTLGVDVAKAVSNSLALAGHRHGHLPAQGSSRHWLRRRHDGDRSR